jgi:hypothetical protein
MIPLMARFVSTSYNGPRYAESAEDLQRRSAPSTESTDLNILFNGGGGVGIEEPSKSVEELVLWSEESEMFDTSKCGGLTLSRIIEAFPLARTYAIVIMSKSPVAKGERESVAL